MRGGARRRGLLAAVAFAVACAGCAPHLVRPPAPASDVVRARFASQLHTRVTRGGEVEGELNAWLHRDGVNDPPGASARLWLESPAAFRVRVDGLVGTALEAAARGDSLVVHAPAWKLGAVSADATDRGGLGNAGSVAWRLMAAAWSPPDSAWAEATTLDARTRVTWRDGGDTLALGVTADGLPAEAHLRRQGIPALFARYERWQVWDGVSWPARIVVGDEAGRTRVTLQLQALRLRPRGASPLVRLRVPPNAIEVTGGDWLRLLDRLTRRAAGSESGEGSP